jgi:hypothetical protein
VPADKAGRASDEVVHSFPLSGSPSPSRESIERETRPASG